jgi:hypothetical protein
MTTTKLDRIDPPTQIFVNLMSEAVTTEEQLSLLRSRYDVRPVDEQHDFTQEAVYLILGVGNNYLVQTIDPTLEQGMLHIASFLNEKPMKPLDLKRLQASIKLQRVFLIARKPIDTAARDEVLDMGAFSQLVEAAQRSGMVPGVSAIIQIRDCEFRLGRYQQALQLMESQFASFSANAAQRSQRLAREDADIACGRVRMSPKDLQAKRVRDNRETAAIDRARTRFMRVVEGLRTLVQLGV